MMAEECAQPPLDFPVATNKKRIKKLQVRLVMKETNAPAGSVRPLRQHPRSGHSDSEGILVQEDELSTATAQRLYRMRCECGRSWFELELKSLIKCPSCSRLNRVEMV
jgi:hypothetical protein